MLKPKIKALWLEALRSGEYEQGRYRLRNVDNKFCCLGVLCNLHAQANPEFAKKQHNPTMYGGTTIYPPIEVILWATTNKDLYMHNLAEMNDSGMSFKEISHFIEKRL